MRLDLGPTLPALKAAAYRRVDAAAEAARSAWLTPGAGQAMEYQATEQEARAWVAAVAAGGSPVIADYPFLAAEYEAISAASPITPAEVVAIAIGLADAWTATGAEIKRLRRLAKLTIGAATTPAEVAAAEAVAWPLPT